jgi:hypothetical protein
MSGCCHPVSPQPLAHDCANIEPWPCAHPGTADKQRSLRPGLVLGHRIFWPTNHILHNIQDGPTCDARRGQALKTGYRVSANAPCQSSMFFFLWCLCVWTMPCFDARPQQGLERLGGRLGACLYTASVCWHGWSGVVQTRCQGDTDCTKALNKHAGLRVIASVGDKGQCL